MTDFLLPSTLARCALPDWQFPAHIQALQNEVLETLYSTERNRLIVEIPVRHGKSYFCSYVLPSWYAITHPDQNVWVVSYGADFATEWSAKVRRLVDEWGPELTGVSIDPTYRPRAHFRMKPPNIGELRGLGIGGGLAGKGFHLCICDDLVKEFGEVATEEAREKLYRQFHGELLTRAEPGGKIVIVMSRRHPDDLSGRLLESNEQLEPREQWHRIKFPALSEDDSTALWSERYPVEKLLAIRNDFQVAGEEWQWHSLYQQDPATAAELCEWPAEYWNDLYYTDLPAFTPRMRLLSLDPSMGKTKKKGDFSALLFGLVDPEGTLWIDDPVLVRMPVGQLEDLAVAMIKQHKPHAFAVETNNFQAVVADNIYKKAPHAQIYPYNNMRGEAKDAGYSDKLKQVEIRMMLSPILRRHGIKIRDTPQGRILGQQLRDFPLASHDDGPDALALMVRLWRDLLGLTGNQPVGDERIYT